MKFLVDAQLPVRLAKLLQEAGYDTIHTKNLPQSNRTTDQDINSLKFPLNSPDRSIDHSLTLTTT